MITSIIFSKNRPLQLDLCIKSIKTNFLDCNQIFVLEKYEDDYNKMLDVLSNEHQDINIFQQTSSIYHDCLDLCKNSINNHICLLTDDDIVYKKIDHIECDNLFQHEELCTISLRLGLNTVKREYLHQVIDDIPMVYFENIKYLFIPKTSYHYGSYWSYSHSLDGHIFRKDDLIQIFDELYYLDKKYLFKQSPNELETQMQKYWALTPNIIVCQKHSTVVNSPNNRTQNTHLLNKAGSYFSYSPEKLSTLYKNGYRIQLSTLNFDNVDCPHKEIDILSDINYDI